MNDYSVLYLIGQLDRGGAEQQLYHLLARLHPRATVVSFSPGGYWAEPIRQLGYQVIELERHHRLEVQRLRQVHHLIRTLKPDITHLFLDSVSGLYGRLAVMLARNTRFIVNEGNHPTYHPQWYQNLLPFLNRDVKAVIANSYIARDYMLAHHMIRPQQAGVVFNGLDINKFLGSVTGNWPLPETWRGKPIIGTVAHLTNNKSPENFIRVAAQVVKKYPDARFVFVGEGPLRPVVEALRDELGVTDVVQLIGERRDVPDLLKAMSMFILTSRVEGSPNAIIEAMASGLPCVVTDSGGCRELVLNGVTGFVVPIGDDDAMAAHICTLLGDETLRRQMGEKGKERSQLYSLDVFTEAFSTIYQNLLETGEVQKKSTLPA